MKKEIKKITWEFSRPESFPCMLCNQEAEYQVDINVTDDFVLHLCLCEDCAPLHPEIIVDRMRLLK